MVWNGYEGRQTRLLYVFIDLTGHNVRSRFSSIPISREVKHHVHVKRQTQSFPFACRLLFIISTHKLVISRYSQELSELFLSAHFLFWEVLAYTWSLNSLFWSYRPIKRCIDLFHHNLWAKNKGSWVQRSGKFQHKLQHRYLLSLLFVAFHNQSPPLTMVNCTASFLRL